MRTCSAAFDALDRMLSRAPHWREAAFTCYAAACAEADRTRDPVTHMWAATLVGALRRDDPDGAEHALRALIRNAVSAPSSPFAPPRATA
jgi:hypothetical protein